ncbi:MAG: cytochrome c, partial [Gemmatimonadota bacterium]|nr:cytochrome c [Gemmatimonadota bacterium]
MMRHQRAESRLLVGTAAAALVAAAFAMPAPAAAQDSPSGEVTFSRDIAPILQRSCQQCHRPGGVAPMPLVEYDDVRRHATNIMRRTGIRDRQGTMPPWYVEKGIGIQQYKDDPSLSDEEVEAIASWARNGAPEGNPADLPPRLVFDEAVAWRLGQPDLIVSTEEVLVAAEDPDWWGDMPPIPITGLSEDRYVASVEIREINDVGESGGRDRETVGGL